MILIIGEKPNVSKAISSAVGAKEERKGYNVGNDFVVSWCLGHLVSMQTVYFPTQHSRLLTIHSPCMNRNCVHIQERIQGILLMIWQKQLLK